MKRKEVFKYLAIIFLVSIAIRVIGQAIKDTKNFDQEMKLPNYI